MKGYLGETELDISKTEYSMYSQQAFAMLFIEMYGTIDGAHHKAWLIDQIAQILKGTKVIVSLAKWDNGQEEYRFKLGEPSKEYLEWIINND